MIRIITDSTFGIKQNYAKENHIEIVNLKMNLDDKVYEEGFEPTWNEFYSHMKSSKSFPTTSQPSPQDFIDALDRIFNNDKHADVIIVTISERLSGTVNSARLAVKNYPDKNIAVVDSREATTCGRFMIEELVSAIKKGNTFNEILSLITILQQKLKIQFIPKTLEYLKRGGRIGTLGASFATIINIKPLFCFENGDLKVKKMLGFQRAICECINCLPEKIKKLAVCYIHDKSDVDILTDKLTKKFPDIQIELVAIEPVFGVHVGIGAIGIATLSE